MHTIHIYNYINDMIIKVMTNMILKEKCVIFFLSLDISLDVCSQITVVESHLK